MTTSDQKTPNSSLEYPETDDDAHALYEQYSTVDPLPQIKAAQLNSADIAEYVSKTGMIWPFRPERLTKPASYAVLLKGRCIYWDENGKKQDFILSDEPIDGYENYPHRKEFALAQNSIAFITLEPTIRLPDYIAVRFNLTIQDVYRGMILGTGPLVDPGFQGKLSFPLHNLTNNKYTYRAGDELVWMEFTKLSRWHEWYPDENTSQEETREGEFVPFPGRKLLRKDVADYLEHASGGDAVRSSIPVVIEQSRKELENSGKRVDDLEVKITKYTSLGALIGIIAAAALIIGGYEIITSTLQLISDEQSKITSIDNKISTLVGRLDKLVKSANFPGNQMSIDAVKTISDEVESLREDVERLKSNAKINAIADDVESLREEVKRLKENAKKEDPSSAKQN